MKNIKKINIKKDNACLYRTLSYLLYYNSQLKDYKTIIRKGIHINWALNKQLISIKSYNSNDLPKLLQKTIINWIYMNSEQYIDEIGYKVFDLLVDTHYPELLEKSSIVSNRRLFRKNILAKYKDRYSSFAGDSTIEHDYIGDRWGGTLELYAFSKIFDICIHVYELDNSKEYKRILQLGSNKKLVFNLLYSENHYDCLIT